MKFLFKGLFFTIIAASGIWVSGHYCSYLAREKFEMVDSEVEAPIQRTHIRLDFPELPKSGFPAVPHIGLCIKPHVLSLASEGKLVISMIGLPEAFDPHDINRDSIELSLLSCPTCESLHPTRQYPSHGSYTTYFLRQDLIEKLKRMNVDARTRIYLKIYGEMNDGTPFEGLESIWVIEGKRSE
jgi:hypothetical protein